MDQDNAQYRIARTGRGRWLVSDAKSAAPLATFDGWRAARDYAKTLGKLAPAAAASGALLPDD